jgi:uncharacterized protein (DUF427 family)
MARATWQGEVIAESDDTVVVDGYTYFPKDAVRSELLEPSEHRSVCPWKGEASYYSVAVDGAVNRDAAWEYRTPKTGAEMVRDRIAFWRGVEVER